MEQVVAYLPGDAAPVVPVFEAPNELARRCERAGMAEVDCPGCGGSAYRQAPCTITRGGETWVETIVTCTAGCVEDLETDHDRRKTRERPKRFITREETSQVNTTTERPLGERIRAHREAHGLSQRQFGLLAGIDKRPQMQVSKLEAGKYNPNPERLEAIERLLAGPPPVELPDTRQDAALMARVENIAAELDEVQADYEARIADLEAELTREATAATQHRVEAAQAREQLADAQGRIKQLEAGLKQETQAAAQAKHQAEVYVGYASQVEAAKGRIADLEELLEQAAEANDGLRARIVELGRLAVDLEQALRVFWVTSTDYGWQGRWGTGEFHGETAKSAAEAVLRGLCGTGETVLLATTGDARGFAEQRPGVFEQLQALAARTSVAALKHLVAGLEALEPQKPTGRGWAE